MLIKKHWRIFFLIASLLFAQHAAALHVFAHLHQTNSNIEQFDQTKQDSDAAGLKWCEMCLTLAEMGNGIASAETSLTFHASHFHFSAVDSAEFSPPTHFAYRSRAPPAL
jgi:hypothetical protein